MQANDCLAKWEWRVLDEQRAFSCSHRPHLFHFRYIIQRVGKELVKFAV